MITCLRPTLVYQTATATDSCPLHAAVVLLLVVRWATTQD